MKVIEKAIQFGEGRRLLGILAMPEQPIEPRTAIIIPNTGLEHRVGPNRLHVHLSRAFAEAGFPALRLDLSGMGDSKMNPANPLADSVADLTIALDELSRMQVAERFVAVGLCSGGHDAHLLAMADRRIIAGAFIDHYAYHTMKFHYRYWAQRLTDLRRIRGWVSRHIKSDPKANARWSLDDFEYFTQPPLGKFRSDIAQLMERHVALYFLYTGEWQKAYNYRDQLFDSCPELRGYDAAEAHFRPEADHTFSNVRLRADLAKNLTAWLGRVTGTPTT